MTPDQQTARPIRATGPSADPDQLREAYLELLKLTLCDLANARTESVMLTIDHSGMFSKESDEEELVHRATGMHWSLHGLTMVGLTRLDHLQRCVESVVREGVDGDLIEAGVWRGGASILMRATLNSLDAGREVWLADSFEGFPEPDEETFPADSERDLSRFDFFSIPVEEVRANFARLGLNDGIRFVPGFFDETMPALRGGTWSVVRIDSDTYESTWLALDALYPGLSAGGHLIIDDYYMLPECRRAVDEYRREHGVSEPLEPIDWNSVGWRRNSQPTDPRPAPAAAPLSRSGSARSGALKERLPVPTEREQELEDEIKRLREELEQARAQLTRTKR
jgi:O-methyltransferase